MKKYLILVLIVLIIGTLFIGVQAIGKGVTKSTGKDAAAMIPAGERFPNSAYDNEWQIPGAKGKVNMIQPNGNVDIILGVSVDGLATDTEYSVSFDTNGGEPGPWVFKGYFTTDGDGHGEWNYTAPAELLTIDVYTWSVYINRTDVGLTVLISDDISFEIE